MLQDSFADMAQLDGSFFMCQQDDQKAIADLIHPLDMSLRDRFVFCAAPISTDDRRQITALMEFANLYSRHDGACHYYPVIFLSLSPFLCFSLPHLSLSLSLYLVVESLRVSFLPYSMQPC